MVLLLREKTKQETPPTKPPRDPKPKQKKLSELNEYQGRAFEITGEEDHTIDVDDNDGDVKNVQVQNDKEKSTNRFG